MRLLKRLTALFIALACIGSLWPAKTIGYEVQHGNIMRDGDIIQLHGVNWFGFETDNYVAHGLWSRSWQEMITQMQRLGINAVRLPFCPTTLDGVSVSGIDYTLNDDLTDLDSLAVLDTIVTELNRRHIYILFDHHRPDCSAISELWYTDTYSEADWIDDLVFLAQRYGELEYVLGLDLKNEPHGTATWGTGNSATDWDGAAARAAEAILAVNDDWLIFVEGIQENAVCSGTVSHWWGGNLEPLRCYPLDIPQTQLVLSPHVYGPDVYGQSYFYETNFPDNLPAIWEDHFGQWRAAGYAVAIGEFGGKYGHGGSDLDVTWQNALVDYLRQQKINDSFYWSWNPNSGDTGGILQDDWTTVHDDKVELLQQLWFGGTKLAATQLRVDAAGNDHTNLDNEYIKIKNISGRTLRLQGWTIADKQGHSFTLPRLRLKPRRSLTMVTGVGQNRTSGKRQKIYWQSRRAIWNNDHDRIVIKNAAGVVQLKVSY